MLDGKRKATPYPADYLGIVLPLFGADEISQMFVESGGLMAKTSRCGEYKGVAHGGRRLPGGSWSDN